MTSFGKLIGFLSGLAGGLLAVATIRLGRAFGGCNCVFCRLQRSQPTWSGRQIQKQTQRRFARLAVLGRVFGSQFWDAALTAQARTFDKILRIFSRARRKVVHIK